MIRLASNTTQQLLEHFETGMGYQLVRGNLSSRYRHHVDEDAYYVMNAELLLSRSELPLFRERVRTRLLEQMQPHQIYKQILETAEPSPEFVLQEVFTRAKARLFFREAEAPALGGASSHSPKATTESERFARFTAFLNDRRITEDKGLLPGTFGTTKEDSEKVKTGKEAVARYALPNPDPAIFRFPIAPPSGTVHQVGVVQAAFGQPGGGVEVLFGDGVASKSVGSPTTLPAG